jgi:hypothetical protein
MVYTPLETTTRSASGISRRTLFHASLPLGAAGLLGGRAESVAASTDVVIPEYFPRMSDLAVREMVEVAHFALDRVKLLLETRPALANAAWDWGFGDWETAIGAASHMGRRDIAEALLAAGARPDLFTHAMLGNLGAVRAIIETRPGSQSVLGPHGITLLSHARAGNEGAAEVVRYLEQLGDADRRAQPVPLARALAAYLGTFAYGTATAQRFQIVDHNGAPAYLREGGFAIRLSHLGGDVFHPVAAPAVRLEIRFEGERAKSITVRDAALVLTAERVD